MSETATVVTGQQIGLLGGPLYTVYKVLGAAHLAGKLNGNAVYWLETNDADFNEINHIDYLDAQGQLKTLIWDIDTQGYSCGHIEVDDPLVNLLNTFFSTIRQTEFTPDLKDLVLGCYAKGRTLAEASVQLASELFGFLNPRLFNPFDGEFRKFTQPILLKEARRTPDGQQCNCFCMVGKQRKAMFRKGEGFQLRDNTPVDPEKHELVPNVKTRSVCQDAYFNAHTYVAGPGEVKYLAEMDRAYEFHGVKKAAVLPRMSLSLIEPRVDRLMKKMGLNLETILNSSKEELRKEVMKTETGFDFKEASRTADGLTAEYLGKLEPLGLNPQEIKALRKVLLMEMKKTFGQVRAREKEKLEQVLKNAEYLSDNLLPFGKRQERVFNIFYYMNLYGGKAFINRLYENYDGNRKTLEIEHG